MIEVKIDETTLPKDGQKVKWQTKEDIDSGTFKTGIYNAEPGLFLHSALTETTYDGWDTVYDVYQWEPVEEIPKSFSDGFYWVKYHDRWEIAKHDTGKWFLTASHVPVKQSAFDEIMENPITPPFG